MPAYSRQSSEWTRTVMRHRDGGAWTADDALGFVRVGSEWVQFQAPDAAELGQPINLSADVGDNDATLTWTNDLNEAIDTDSTPVYVQYRLPETTPVWTEELFPSTVAAFGFLTEETTYQFQVRYITRDPSDGTLDLTGPITEVFFTTLALTGPGTPAEDPGGTGPDTTVPWGNTGGTPGTVGGSDCWWEYIVQTATTPASGTLTWGDTAVTGDFDGDAGSLDIDFVAEGLTCGALARFKYREVCNSVPGDYDFGEPFVMVCDWDSDCGGVANTGWILPPYNDANIIHAMPKVCVDATDPIQIEDHTTSTVYGKNPGFFGVSSENGEDIIVGGTIVGYGSIVAGKVGELALLTNSDDFSASLMVQLADVPGGSGGSATDAFPIGRWGRNVALSAVRASSTTWYPRVSWQDQAGTGQTLTGTTALPLDEMCQIGVTFDNTGSEVLLYGNGVGDGTEADDLALEDAAMGEDMEIYGNSFIRVKRVAAWDRVLTPAEMSTAYSLDKYPSISWMNINEDLDSVPTMDVEAGDWILVASFKTFGYISSPSGLNQRGPADTGVVPINEDWDDGFNFSTSYGSDDFMMRFRGYMARGDGVLQHDPVSASSLEGHIVINLGKVWNHVDGVDSFKLARDYGTNTGSSTTTDTLIADPGGDETIYFQLAVNSASQVESWVPGATDLKGSQVLDLDNQWRGEDVTFGAMWGPWDASAGAVTERPYSVWAAINIEQTLAPLTGTPEVRDDGTHYNFVYDGSVNDSGVLVATGIGSPPATADLFLVGGGGGGSYPGNGGGGGGGQVDQSTGVTLTLPVAVTLGQGGAGGNAGYNFGLSGTDTTALGVTATGGQGAAYDYNYNSNALGLGQRGGGSNDDYNGGSDVGSSYGGGGAGAGGVGEDAKTTAGADPGDGGPGVSNTWRTGASLGYGGGGGGGGSLGGTAGVGQDGGGNAGDPPTGGLRGGGGGSRHKNFGGSMTGAAGGDGFAMIKVAK